METEVGAERDEQPGSEGETTSEGDPSEHLEELHQEPTTSESSQVPQPEISSPEQQLTPSESGLPQVELQEKGLTEEELPETSQDNNKKIQAKLQEPAVNIEEEKLNGGSVRQQSGDLPPSMVGYVNCRGVI
jgi:hypothetical protein